MTMAELFFRIRRISSDKESYMPLLLEADPSPVMIRLYLDPGELYVLCAQGQPAAVAVILRLPDGDWELKNLATAPEMRGRGFGSRLLRHIIDICPHLWVGTSPANVDFYKRFGFVECGVKPHFFRDNYPEPIIEDGQPLDDMLMLSLISR